MLTVPDVVASTYAESQIGEVWGEASYQGRTARLDLVSGSMTWDADGQVETAADFEVAGATGSLVPRSPTDFLAANGQEVTLYRDLIFGDGQTYTIPLGVLRVKDNDGGSEVWQNTIIRGNFGRPGLVFVTENGLVLPNDDIPELEGTGFFSPENLTFDPASGLYLAETVRGDLALERRLLSWRVGVSAAGRMRAVERASRLDRLSPVPGNSMWDEVRRIALFPVAETVPDRAVPASLAYEDTMQAHRELAKLAGCVPTVDRYGALRFRQEDRWLTATVPEFEISGTVSWSAPQDDDFYNEVVASSPDGDIVAVAAITDDSNPFSVNRAGRRTLRHSSPLYTTQAAADAGARTRLESAQRRSRTVTVECLPEALLLDMGDFGWMHDPVQGRSALGEVIGMRMSVDPTDTVEVTLRAREVHG